RVPWLPVVPYTTLFRSCNAWFARAGLAARVHFRVQELEVLNDQERYDLVLSVDVMEHIEADEKVMQNLCRALKPGGLLLISTPSDRKSTRLNSSHVKIS